ncbi:MAG: flagellar motor switch protein FliN [Krumholzibacteria bacterium]|nr:flagellar motor switch protein FliN [Candidatus Krumholzibacteria bacterium]
MSNERNPDPRTPADAPTTVLDAESTSLLRDLGDAVPNAQNLDLLLDVNLQVSVELGRARLKFRDVLNLAQGSVVELTRQSSEPVDIMVNGALLATGEVVVVDDHFAVRVTKLLNRVERLKRVL